MGFKTGYSNVSTSSNLLAINNKKANIGSNPKTSLRDAYINDYNPNNMVAAVDRFPVELVSEKPANPLELLDRGHQYNRCLHIIRKSPNDPHLIKVLNEEWVNIELAKATNDFRTGFFSNELIACTLHTFWLYYFEQNLNFNSLFPLAGQDVLSSVNSANSSNYYSLPFVGYLFRNSHWSCFLIKLVPKDESDPNSWDTLMITIADSIRPMSEGVNGKKICQIIPGTRVPDYFHQLVHTVAEFRNYTVVVRYINCPQQYDGHSCGMYTIINAIAFAKYGTTDVIDHTKVNTSYIKRQINALLIGCLEKESIDFGNL